MCIRDSYCCLFYKYAIAHVTVVTTIVTIIAMATTMTAFLLIITSYLLTLLHQCNVESVSALKQTLQTNTVVYIYIAVTLLR